MTDTQYLLGWVIYLLGGSGCLLGVWLVVKNWPARIRRFLMAFLAVLIYLPGLTQADMSFMAPAFLISLFDGLTYGPDAMLRAGKVLAVTAGVASLVAVALPVRKKKSAKKKKNEPSSANTKSDHGSQPATRQRKEPVY